MSNVNKCKKKQNSSLALELCNFRVQKHYEYDWDSAWNGDCNEYDEDSLEIKCENDACEYMTTTNSQVTIESMEDIEFSNENKSNAHRKLILRNKKSNKKIKIKNLIKSNGLASHLKHRVLDPNGNVIDSSVKNCLANVMLTCKGKTYLNKGKSKLHIKYNVYNKFKLCNLEEGFIKPFERCAHIYSDDYMLKHAKPKEVTKPVQPVQQPPPLIFNPPPPPPKPVVEEYTIPNYMYKLNARFQAIAVYNYDQFLNQDKMAYDNFFNKTRPTPIETSETILPFKALIECIQHDTSQNLLKYFCEFSLAKQLLTLLSVLTDQKPLFKSFNSVLITTNDTIKLPSVEKTTNYHSSGFGFGTGDVQSVWSMRLTLWKVKTERGHIAQLFKIFDVLLHKLKNASIDCNILLSVFYNSCLVNTVMFYLKNSSIIDISESCDIYSEMLQFLNNFVTIKEFKDLLITYKVNIHATNMLNILNLYLSKIKDDQLSKLTLLVNELIGNLNIPVETKTDVVKVNSTSKKNFEKLYCDSIKDFLFDTYKMVEERDGKLEKLVPYHYPITQASGNSFIRSKRIAQEIVTLSNSLPLSSSSSVFVRCDEDNIDIMKVLITGPEDTPYSMGCFEFDISFPFEFPKVPPNVILKTTGNGSVRFNPNLYNCGKVCLSIINTWYARPEESWNPDSSTLLQILVSIQSLIFVPEPYFNEPGYQCQYKTAAGDLASASYNAIIMEATLKWAILEMIKKPSECFQNVIQEHFYLKLSALKAQCQSWRQKLQKISNKSLSKFDEYIKELENELANLKNLKEAKNKTENAIDEILNNDDSNATKTDDIYKINDNRDTLGDITNKNTNNYVINNIKTIDI